VKLFGRICPFCRNMFCLSHSMAEIHGCGEAAKKSQRGGSTGFQGHLQAFNERQAKIIANSAPQKDRKDDRSACAKACKKTVQMKENLVVKNCVTLEMILWPFEAAITSSEYFKKTGNNKKNEKLTNLNTNQFS